jgi:prepilin-type N-terminal cleavage/methylation domain-containing protein
MRGEKQKKGFTLLEILLVIAAIGILAAIVLIAINPNKQIEAARTAQRRSDLNSISKAIQQFIIDPVNGGAYPGGMVNMSTNGSRVVCKTGTEQVGGATDCTGYADLRALVPTYIAGIPAPNTGDYIVTRTVSGASASYDSSTIWAIAGSTEPTLDLNFARDKQLTNAVTGTNPITFTRASPATYVDSDGLLKTAVANEARFEHNPVTRESLGLLVEEQRTNLRLRSEEFDNASWIKPLTTITVNATTSPSGTLTADKFIGTNALGGHFVYSNAAQASGIYTASIYARAAERQEMAIFFDTNIARRTQYFNLSAGSLGSNTGGITGSITSVGNGWYRCSITLNAAESIVNTAYALAQSGSIDFIGDNTSGILIWGAQLELGAFPTSYIPTVGAAVTRNADDVLITGSNFTSIGGSPNTGTLFSQGIFPFTYNNGNPSPYFGIDNNSVTNELLTRTTIAHSSFAGNAVINSTGLASIVGTAVGSIGAGQLGSMALGYSTGNSRTAANGTLGTLSNTAFSGGGFDTARIGSSISYPRINYMNGTIKRVMYWNTRLADNILQSLTQ